MGNVLFRTTIVGQPRVKKNGQHVAFNNGKPRKYNTPAYAKWLQAANRQLNYQILPARPIDQPVILLCTFFMQTKGLVDLSALYEGIQDLLVKREILADDNSRIIIGHDGSRVYYDKDNPRMEILVISAPNSSVGTLDNTPYIGHRSSPPSTNSVF